MVLSLMTESLDERVKKTLDDPTITDEQIARFEDILRDNSCRSGTQAMRSLLLFIIFTIVWLLVRSSYIQKFTISGIEINDPQLLLIIIPPMAAFIYYNYICLLIFNAVMDETLIPLHRIRMPAFEKNSLTELLIYPEFFYSENALKNLLGDNKNSLLYRFSNYWTIFLGLFLLYTPALILLSMTYDLIRYSLFENLIPIASALFVVLLLARSLIVTVELFKVI
jgi:hypothetical protein